MCWRCPARAEHSSVCSLPVDLFGASIEQHLLQKEASPMRAEINESMVSIKSFDVSLLCLFSRIIGRGSPLGPRTCLATGSEVLS